MRSRLAESRAARYTAPMTIMTPLAAVALAIINTISPATAPHETLPGWAETPTARLERYNRIAGDIAAVVEVTCAKAVDDKAVARCQRWALPVLIGIAYHESGFAPDVDAGRCYRGRDGNSQRCDGGLARSAWQLRAGGEEARLFETDRRAAAREALRRATRSWNGCRKLPVEERLAAYASGNCTNPAGRREARSLWGCVQRALRAWPVEETLVAVREPRG